MNEDEGLNAEEGLNEDEGLNVEEGLNEAAVAPVPPKADEDAAEVDVAVEDVASAQNSPNAIFISRLVSSTSSSSVSGFRPIPPPTPTPAEFGCVAEEEEEEEVPKNSSSPIVRSAWVYTSTKHRSGAHASPPSPPLGPKPPTPDSRSSPRPTPDGLTYPLYSSRTSPALCTSTQLSTPSLFAGHTPASASRNFARAGREAGWDCDARRRAVRCAGAGRVRRRLRVLGSSGGRGAGVGAGVGKGKGVGEVNEVTWTTRGASASESESELESTSMAHVLSAAVFEFLVLAVLDEASSAPMGRAFISAVRRWRYAWSAALGRAAYRGGAKARRFARRCTRPSGESEDTRWEIVDIWGVGDGDVAAGEDIG